MIFWIQCKMYFKWAFFCLCPKPKLSSCTYFPDLLVRVLESPLTCCIQLVYTHGEKGRENTVRVTVMVREGEFPVKKKRKEKKRKKKKTLSHSCSAVRLVEATVRAEIATSASPVMDVSLNDCCTSVQTDGSRQKLCPFDSEADAKPWC